MTIKPFYFNPYRECTYLVWDEQSQNHKALLIDAGMYGAAEEKRMQDFLSANSLSLVALLITHTHPDHICGVEFVQRTYGIAPIIFPPEGKLLLPDFEGIEVIHTPGHKEDAVCYYWQSQGCVFTGDTLFRDSIGRTDLEGGDMPTLIRSLQRLTILPDDTIVYPGHGYSTTIGREKQFNPYL